jgi:hypothetical protein
MVGFSFELMFTVQLHLTLLLLGDTNPVIPAMLNFGMFAVVSSWSRWFMPEIAKNWFDMDLIRTLLFPILFLAISLACGIV